MHRLLLSAFALVLTSPAHAAGTIQVIAVDNGEGATDGPTYVAFSNPVLNEAGLAAFVGFRVTGAFGQPDLAGGVYVGAGHSPLDELAKVGDASFFADSFASSFTVQAINDVGQVAYLETARSIETGASLGSGLFLRVPGIKAPPLVKRGDLDADGDSLTLIRFFDLDRNGRIGLTLTYSGVTDSTAIYEAGGLRILAKRGQPAPDGIGIVDNTFHPSVNDAGQIRYTIHIVRPGLPVRPALFRESPGVGLELLLRSGDAITSPGIDGTLLLEHYVPSMNETGDLIFVGLVSDATDPANNGRGLFVVDGPSSVRALIREGQAVPGGSSLASFGRPSLNRSGHAAFYALITNDPGAPPDIANVGIYRTGAVGLTQIARQGQATPGGDGKIHLPSFLGAVSPRYEIRPLFNNNGQVAFRSTLADTASGAAGEHAIFFYDDALGLIEIARTGTPLLGSTVVDIGLRQSNLADSHEEVGFNNAGQIAFRFTLADDREGVAIWSPDSSPGEFRLTITPATASATGYDFTWPSQPGKIYDLVTSTHPTTPVAQWPVHAAYSDIPATGTTTTLTAVPADGRQRFFALIEKDAPPVD
jgi:hypothetical protein